MATPKIKATYSLDPETVDLLERVSRRWGVSKSEALRRAIRASAARTSRHDGRLAALDRLQAAAALDATAAAQWARRVRTARNATDVGSKRRA